VPTAEAAAFATRTGCLFVEASAKTAVGVTEAFNDVVARIIDTPSLWREENASEASGGRGGGGGGGAVVARNGRRGAVVAGGERPRIPRNINLSQVQDDGDSSGTCCC
jgi:Ras-related protein Rab-18